MYNSENIQLGNRVLILRPAYVAGEFGFVLQRETGKYRRRWLIQVENKDIIVSLTTNDFQILDQEK